MERYHNLSGDSGVIAYETHANAIDVEFKGGAVYRYTDRSAGRSALDRMKQLARSGRGLSTFISRYVAKRYAERLR